MSLSKSQIVFIALLIIGLLIAGWFTYTNYLKKGVVSEDSAAFVSLGTKSDTTYTDVSGNPVNLSQYLGRILVVNSWASWSPFSAPELQTLSEVAREYSSDEVVILAINRAEPKETAVAFLRVHEISSEVELILDKGDVFYKSINGFSMPETVVFDEAGDIILHQRGVLDQDKLSSVVNEALNQMRE